MENNDIERQWTTFKRFIALCLVGIVLISFLALVYRAIGIALTLALILAYIFSPLTEKLAKVLRGKRSISAGIVVVGLLGFLGFLIAAILPALYREILEIFKLVPDAAEYMFKLVTPIKEWVLKKRFFDEGTVNSAFQEIDFMTQLGGQASSALKQVWQTSPKLLGGAINAALFPIFMYFILVGMADLRKMAKSLVPNDLVLLLKECSTRIDKTLRSVIKGQLIVAGILGILYMIGFSIVNLKFGAAIGAIAGICRVIPYFDVIVGLTLALIVIITQSSGFGQLIAVCVVFAIVQGLDGMLITPRVVGERAGLHPMVVVGSIIAFGDWFGFFGVLIAVPVVATAIVLYRFVLPYYQISPFYQASSLPEISQDSRRE